MRSAWLILVVLSLGCGHRAARRALERGEHAAALAAVQGTDSEAYALRGRALVGLGQQRQARHALVIALVLEPGNADACRTLAHLEKKLGNKGAALHLFERLIKLERGGARERHALAELLLERARLRLDRRLGMRQQIAAERDVGRALALAPELRERARAMRGLVEDPPRAEPAPGCPGVPRRWARSLPRRRRCRRNRDQAVAALRRRYLLVGCAGVQVATALERRGCLRQSLAVWRALSGEMPQDPRWLLARARILLALGRRHRARQLLSDFTFFSADRARANLVAARLLLRAKRTRLAARRVVEALEHGASGRAALEAVALLRRAGYRRQARAAAEMALERPPAAVGQASWQTALERALGGPLSRRAPARRRRRR